MKPTILLTGATGYIASHTWLALWSAGFDVVGVDDFSNSSPEVLNRLQRLGGRPVTFERANVCDSAAMTALFQRHSIAAVVHFAAFKAVGESTARPLDYYRNNLGGLLCVADAMARFGGKALVFSSSATVYGAPEQLPIPEDAALASHQPLRCDQADGREHPARHRARRPGVAHRAAALLQPGGRTRQRADRRRPRGIPNNLMPYITQVAVGKRARLQVFGDDYDTPDGTGVRDYIHVTDLAEGHVAALRHLLDAGGRSITVNLGTGQGCSVLGLVRAFEQASGRPIPYDIVARRPGDVAACYADATRAREFLGWQATRGIDVMCADTWRWQSLNPNGYAD